MNEQHIELLKESIRKLSPKGAKVWIFGSMARGKVTNHSDLDLLLDFGRQATYSELGEIRDAIMDLDVPYQIDLVDLQSTDETFRKRIVNELIEINLR